MQTTINKKDFINALTIGGAMAGKNKTLPILEFAKVEVSADNLSVHSFNGESWVMKQTKVESSDVDFSFCISPNDLIKALKSLAEEVVTFSIEGKLLHIDHFKGTMDMPTMPSEHFPMAQTTDDGVNVCIKTDKLKEWLGIATNFVADDELRPIMTGMYLYAKSGSLGVCATNAHKLFTDSIEMDCNDFEVTIPASSFRPLMNIISNSMEVSAIIGEKQISFSTSDSSLHCRLVEGRYPNFRSVIPRNNSIYVKVSKSELLDSVQRASLMANATTSLLKLSVTDSVMDVEGRDVDLSKKAKDSVKVEKEGSDITIGVKADFFADCLSTVDSEDVVLKMENSQRAIVFEDSLNTSKVVLVMPMMID